VARVYDEAVLDGFSRRCCLSAIAARDPNNRVRRVLPSPFRLGTGLFPMVRLCRPANLAKRSREDAPTCFGPEGGQLKAIPVTRACCLLDDRRHGESGQEMVMAAFLRRRRPRPACLSSTLGCIAAAQTTDPVSSSRDAPYASRTRRIPCRRPRALPSSMRTAHWRRAANVCRIPARGRAAGRGLAAVNSRAHP
jgi:hypothetical protein